MAFVVVRRSDGSILPCHGGGIETLLKFTADPQKNCCSYLGLAVGGSVLGEEKGRMTVAHDHKPAKIPSSETYERLHLNTLYREIPLKDNKSRLLRKYFNAMANLYGVISLREALSIIRHFSPRMVLTDEEFLAFAEIARHECEGYCILGRDEIYTGIPVGHLMDREIVSLLLLDTEEDYYAQIVTHQMGMPLYIPEKKEDLLSYAAPLYVEKTEEYRAFAAFLRAHMPSDRPDSTCDCLLDDIFDVLRIDTNLDAVIKFMDEAGIKLAGERDVNRFMELYVNYTNNARLFVNRGYTPEEVSAMYPPECYEKQTEKIDPYIPAVVSDEVFA